MPDISGNFGESIPDQTESLRKSLEQIKVINQTNGPNLDKLLETSFGQDPPRKSLHDQ